MEAKKLVIFYNPPPGLNMSLANSLATEEFLFADNLQDIEQASAVIFHMPGLSARDEIFTKKNNGQLWVCWSEESEARYEWQSKPEIAGLFDIKASYRLDSDVPIPRFSPSHFGNLRREPKIKTGFVNAFISGDADQSGRQGYLQELMSYIEIDSYGKLFNNRRLQDDKGYSTKEETMSGYKFSIAFENSISKDYVTDVLYDPLIFGSVPIYLGAPNVEEFVPGDRCYINVNAFHSVKELAEYLLHLASDERRYDEYLKWKTRPFRTSFNKKAIFVARNSILNLCYALRSKLHSLSTLYYAAN
jgi:hypothetical protein